MEVDLRKELKAKLGVRLHPAIYERWARKGLNGVRLRAEKVKGRWMAMNTDVDRFLEESGLKPKPEPVTA